MVELGTFNAEMTSGLACTLELRFRDLVSGIKGIHSQHNPCITYSLIP